MRQRAFDTEIKMQFINESTTIQLLRVNTIDETMQRATSMSDATRPNDRFSTDGQLMPKVSMQISTKMMHNVRKSGGGARGQEQLWRRCPAARRSRKRRTPTRATAAAMMSGMELVTHDLALNI